MCFGTNSVEVAAPQGTPVASQGTAPGHPRAPWVPVVLTIVATSQVQALSPRREKNFTCGSCFSHFPSVAENTQPLVHRELSSTGFPATP